MKWQAVFFDFDGVILDSVDLKTRAFARMFRPYGPEVERKVDEFHLSNGGVSRYEKFRHYYANLLHRDLSEEKMAELGEEFAGLVDEEVLKVPFIEGALESLRLLQEKGVPAFMVSGTPHEEVGLIVRRRGLEKYFIEVHGAPRKKQEIVRDIASRYSFRMEDCLFIGDATTDYEAAQICGTEFLGIVKKGDQSPFPQGTRVFALVCVAGWPE